MARIVLTALLLVTPAWGQAQTDAQIKQAGVCARCHVISVVEWGISAHQKVKTDCVACHGESDGHVIDERNNIKPEKIPHAAAIAGLCAQCHAGGCGKTKNTADCQSCHHVHALVDPKKAPSTKDERLEKRAEQWRQGQTLLSDGDRLAGLGQWPAAAEAYRKAHALMPGDGRAMSSLQAAENRTKNTLAGFEFVGTERDAATGLPRLVRVPKLGFEMVLVPGGEFEMGAERRPASQPVHTRRVAPFYLARLEVTAGLWRTVMGTSLASSSDNVPAQRISWQDAQSFVLKLNQALPGAGFRLPTEEEWEYAARANSSAAGAPPEDAVYSAAAVLSTPRSAGSGKPGKLGLFDVQGNVWEWCSSLALPYPYDPADGRERPDSPGLRVVRGGGFGDTADLLDLTLRHAERPDRRLQSNGIRLARSVPVQ